MLIGEQDGKHYEKLQINEKLALETEILKTRQAETVTKQQAVIKLNAYQRNIS